MKAETRRCWETGQGQREEAAPLPDCFKSGCEFPGCQSKEGKQSDQTVSAAGNHLHTSFVIIEYAAGDCNVHTGGHSGSAQFSGRSNLVPD